ncbi:MAG: OmpH family outer membrane protein [Bacteroidota bacterium]|nr:OmpH family outer membrane protein [Bacteroidota bacterium]
MKKAIQLLSLCFVLAFTINTSFAQRALKVGHFNASELIRKMPDYDSAQNQLQTYATQLRTELDAMQKEYERMVAEYEAKQDQLSDLLKQNKQKEIQDIYSRIYTFRENSQAELSSKEQELIQAIYEKVRVATENVAKANKYDYIIEKNGILWYATDNDDVTALIEKELGLRK